jgi:hypothetical protein
MHFSAARDMPADIPVKMIVTTAVPTATAFGEREFSQSLYRPMS